VISRDLETVLHRTFLAGRQARHRFVPPEHLLFQLLREKAVAQHLANRSVPATGLHVHLAEYLQSVPTYPPGDSEADTQPSVDFQKAVQRAILSAQNQGRKEATSLDMLYALLDPSLDLSVTQLVAKVIAPVSLQAVRDLPSQLCTLCGDLTTQESWTVVPGRGVLCAECVDAVVSARRAD